MDYMDVDQVVEVPDTPDRLVAVRDSDGNCIGKETDASTNNFVIRKEYANERLRKQPMEKGKSVIINGNRRLFTHPSSCSNSQVSLLSPRSFTNGLSTVDTSRYEKGKALLDSNVQKSTCQEGNDFADMNKQNGPANGFKKATSTGALRNGKVHASRKGLLPVNSFSAVEALDTSSKSHNSDNALKMGPGFDIFGEGVDFVGETQHKIKNNASELLRPSVSSRVTGQKRLVRNGCISPHNISKSKKVVEEHDNVSVAKEVKGDAGATASVGPSSMVDIKDLIAEAKDSVRCKGKGVSRHPSSIEEPDARSRHMSQRSSVTLKEATDGGSDMRVDASRYFKESNGWRTTHNRMRKEGLPFVDGDSHKSKGNDTSSSAIDHQKNGMLQRERRNGRVPGSLNDHLEDLQIVSSSRRAHNLGQFKERAQSTKRQRHKAASSTIGECSSSLVNDSELVILSPSGESSAATPTRNKNLHRAGTSNTVIALGELSSEERNRSSNTRHSRNEDSNVRDLQLEADEMLARELQEQFYSEEPEPSAGIDEMDSNLAFAMAIQQDDSIQHAIPVGGRHASRLRGSPVFNLPQQSRSNASRNPSIRRGVQAQAPTSTRFARLRGRFQGHSRRISSTTRNSIFPPNMDVDMRMQILEALEAVGEMEVPNDLLQVDRDFNENDYDMLLALDENNHRHGGATRAQINNLPQSLVQSENLQECAICLETPTIGETVRHLPCLHKFHKNCIDQWLRRKTSCPVCKSSIT